MVDSRGGFGDKEYDELVLRAYANLFESYELGGSEFIEDLKVLIFNQSVDADLRPDAAYFLLITADQMLLRPYLMAFRERRVIGHGGALSYNYE